MTTTTLLAIILLASVIINICLIINRNSIAADGDADSSRGTGPTAHQQNRYSTKGQPPSHPAVRSSSSRVQQDGTKSPNATAHANTRASNTEQSKAIKSTLKYITELHDYIEEEERFLAASGRKSESVSSLLRLSRQTLEDCGISQFSPRVGESYRTAFGVAPSPKTVRCRRRDADWTIATVVTPGLVATIDQQPYCLKEAMVTVHRFSAKEE